MTTFADAKVWFVTGTSSGIGRTLVEELLASGKRVVATLRKPEVLASLSGTYPSEQLLVLPLDVTDEKQIADAFERTRAHFGRLDVVVNNAGYAVQGEMEAVPEDVARKQVETVYWGPVHIMKEAVKFFRDINPPGQGGRVLNISSAGGYMGLPTFAYYSSGKFALEGFTEAFTKEMPPEWNIKAVIIEAGGFRTSLKDNTVVIPPHPKYDLPNSPSNAFRRHVDIPFFGDSKKAAKVLIRIPEMEDLPLRVQLGTDAYVIVRDQAARTVQDADSFEEFASTTDADGVDRNMVLALYRK